MISPQHGKNEDSPSTPIAKDNTPTGAVEPSSDTLVADLLNEIRTSDKVCIPMFCSEMEAGSCFFLADKYWLTFSFRVSRSTTSPMKWRSTRSEERKRNRRRRSRRGVSTSAQGICFALVSFSNISPAHGIMMKIVKWVPVPNLLFQTVLFRGRSSGLSASSSRSRYYYLNIWIFDSVDSQLTGRYMLRIF